jgi:hypothetical protein
MLSLKRRQRKMAIKTNSKSKPRQIKEWHPESGKGERPLDDWKRLMSEPYEKRVIETDKDPKKP